MSIKLLRGCSTPPVCDVQEGIRSSIQEELDRVLNRPVDAFRSMTIINKRGDLTLPKDVHVRLTDCTIGTLKTEGNNNIYLGNCVLEQPCLVADASVMSDGTTFEGGGTFSQSNVEFINDTIIKDTVLLENGTTLLSTKSAWDGETVSQALGTTFDSNPVAKENKFFIRVDTGSVFTSRRDTYKNINFSVIDGNNGSIISISTPSFEFCLALPISIKPIKLPTIKIPNLPSFPFTCGLIPNLNSALSIFRNILSFSEIETKINNIINNLTLKTCLSVPSIFAKISCRTVLNLKDFGILTTVKTTFQLKDSARLNLSIGNAVISEASIFNGDNKSLFSVRGIVALVSKQDGTSVTDKSSAEFSSVAKVESQLGSVFKANDSKLKIFNVLNLLGFKSIIEAKKNSVASLKGFVKAEADTFVEALEESSVNVKMRKDAEIKMFKLLVAKEKSSVKFETEN